MTLGEIIIKYREEHDLSQRQFGVMCGFSSGYVSMLEKGVNPGTGKPISPTLDKYIKVAAAMGMDFDALMRMADGDLSVKMSAASSSDLTEDEKELINKFRQLDDRGRAAVMNTLNYEYRMMEK